jgi:hypothetical protein
MSRSAKYVIARRVAASTAQAERELIINHQSIHNSQLSTLNSQRLETGDL